MTAQMSPLLSTRYRARPAASIIPSALNDEDAFLQRLPTQHRISIKHPAYSGNDQNLFSLYAWDHKDGALHLGFVLEACHMVSGHQAIGYLSTLPGGPAIEGDAEALLRAGTYYFHLPHPDDGGQPVVKSRPYRWPAVVSFKDWVFHPPSLDSAWNKNYVSENASFTSQQSTITSAIRIRDRTCRVSGHFTGTQSAHLTPLHESQWAQRNSMAMYNIDLTLDPDHLLDDMGNLCLLRSDIHTALDERKVIFYPKTATSYVVHMLEPTPDLAQLYHNREVQTPFDCHPSYLYARMAWAILPSLASFWSKPGVKRAALVLRDTEQGGTEWVEEEITCSADLQARVAASRSRSPKKKKRGREEDDTQDCLSVKHARTVSASQDLDDREASDAGSGPHECTSVDDSPVVRGVEDSRVRISYKPRQTPHWPRSVPELCPSYYPGHEKIDHLKDEWLRQDRSKNGICV